jgi:hypothetical protein
MAKIIERVAVVEDQCKNLKQGLETIGLKVDLIDAKLDKMAMNGVKRDSSQELQAYKIGLWGYVIRVITVAGVTSLIGLCVKVIFNIKI